MPFAEGQGSAYHGHVVSGTIHVSETVAGILCCFKIAHMQEPRMHIFGLVGCCPQVDSIHWTCSPGTNASLPCSAAGI